MDELLALLERYSPGYHDQIQGYADWLLDELEETFGRPLPTSYREFARAMGKEGGPLFAHVRSYDPLLDVTDIYQVVPKSELPPRRFLYVFGDPDPLAPHHYWLDLEAPSEEGDYQVVRMPFGEESWKKKLSRDFVGLREMLFVVAMENVCLPKFPCQVKYYHDERRTAKVEDIARLVERMGFVRLPYPRHSLIFERNGAAIRFYRPPDKSHLHLQVGMSNPDELRRFQAIIEDNTDMEKV